MTRAHERFAVLIEHHAAPEMRADPAERGETLAVLCPKPHGAQAPCLDPRVIGGLDEIDLYRRIDVDEVGISNFGPLAQRTALKSRREEGASSGYADESDAYHSRDAARDSEEAPAPY